MFVHCLPPDHCRENLAHIVQSGPDFGVGGSHFQYEILRMIQVIPSLLESREVFFSMHVPADMDASGTVQFSVSLV